MTSTANPSPATRGEPRAPGELSRQDEAALADLRRRWGDGYEFACRDGNWTARLHGEADVLAAPTAAELEALISRDQAAARTGSSRAGPDRVHMGKGERALRQLRDDGII